MPPRLSASIVISAMMPCALLSMAPRPHTKSLGGIAAKRRMAPVLRDHRDHIGVRHQQHRFEAGGARQSRDQIRLARLAGEDLRLDACLVEDLFQESDRVGSVVGRIAGIEAQVGLEIS